MKKQQGNALLSALFIMSLVAILATTLILQLKTNMQITRLLSEAQTMRIHSEAMRYFAIHCLTQKKHPPLGHTPGETVYEKENIRLKSLPNTVFSIKIIELNSKFNLNQLIAPASKTTFYRLAKHVLEDEKNQRAYPLTADLSKQVKANPLISLSEFHGETKQIREDFEQLKPYVTLLPRSSKININTAPEELLMAMARGESREILDAMETLLQARGQTGIDDLKPLKTPLKNLSIQPTDVITESEYFLSVGEIKTGPKQVVYSLLKRTRNQDGSYAVQLIHESFNTD